MLEWAGVLSWQHRISASASGAPICSGASAGNGACIAAATPTHSVTRSSAPKGPPPSVRKSVRNTEPSDFLVLYLTPPRDPNSPLERALARFDAAIAARLLPNEDSRTGFAG